MAYTFAANYDPSAEVVGETTSAERGTSSRAWPFMAAALDYGIDAVLDDRLGQDYAPRGVPCRPGGHRRRYTV